MNYITKYHNRDEGYISLANLQLAGLPEKVTINGEELLRKQEFHISLACLKRLAPLIDEMNAAAIETQIVDEFLDFVRSNPLQDYTLKNEFYLVQRDVRKTIVVLCDVPGLSELFSRLEQKFGKKLPQQVAHITIYTLQPEAGIGILSRDELAALGQPIQLPELANLHPMV